jgi:hypothetical protein
MRLGAMGARGGFGSAGVLGSVSGTLLSSVVDFWSAGDTSNITTAGSTVSNWIGRRNDRFVQSSGTLQPTSDTTNHLVSFDGSDDILGPGTVSLLSATLLPDGGSGSQNGKGFTCTGITFDDEGYPWVVNIGLVGTGSADVPEAAPGQLIKLSGLTNPSILLKIELSSISATIAGAQGGSVQGLAFDPDDKNLIFGSKNDNSIYVVTKAGALVRQHALGAGVNPNAVGYDQNRGDIVYGRDSSDASPLEVKWINKTTGVVTQTKTVINNPDGLFVRNGEPDILYITYGNNAADGGRLDRYDVTTSANISTLTLTGSAAPEHCYIRENILYLTDDAWYHNVSPSLQNRILTYRLPELYPLGSRICLFGVVRNKTVSATSKNFLSVGSPASSGTRGGVAFGKTSGALRASISKGTVGTQAVTNWTYAGYNTKFVWFLDYNLAAGTVELFVNGTSLGAQAISGPPSALNLYQAAGLGAQYNATPTLYADCEISSFGIATNATQRQIIEGMAAWLDGSQALLPSDHPWKTRAPSVQFQTAVA